MAVLSLFLLLLCCQSIEMKPNPSIGFFPVSDTIRFTEGEGSVLQVCLYNYAGEDLTVHVAVPNDDQVAESGTGYTLLTSDLNFTSPTAFECSGTLLDIKDADKKYNPPRHFNLTASAPTIKPKNVTIIINDNDEVRIGFQESLYLAGDGIVTVEMVGDSAVDISVKLCCKYEDNCDSCADCKDDCHCLPAKQIIFAPTKSKTQLVNVTESALNCHLSDLHPSDEQVVLGMDYTVLKSLHISQLEQEIRELKGMVAALNTTLKEEVRIEFLKVFKEVCGVDNNTSNGTESPKPTSTERPETTSTEPPKTTSTEPPKTTSTEPPKTTSTEPPETTSTEPPETTTSTGPPASNLSLGIGVAIVVALLIVGVAVYVLYQNRKKLGSCLDASPPKQGGGRAGRKRLYQRLPQTMEAALHAD